MLLKPSILLAIYSAAALAAPIDSGNSILAREPQATEFRGASYSHLYKEAKDGGVAKREAEPAAEAQATEFRGASYSHLYKEAKDGGVAKREAEPQATEFRGASYSHLYKEAKNGGVA